MRIPRIYVPNPIEANTSLSLEGSAANHLSRVLRLKPDAPLIIFNGLGGEYSAVIRGLTKRNVTVDIGAYQQSERESPLNITLLQGISRGERMDYTIQKAVELGVSRIIPVNTKRTVVNLDDKRRQKRLQHWQGVIISACEQCGRNTLPILDEIRDFRPVVQEASNGQRLLLDHRSEAKLTQLESSPAIRLLIGPEGGLSVEEREFAYAQGYQGIQLGPRVLRTETAALTAIAAIQTLWGDLH